MSKSNVPLPAIEKTLLTALSRQRASFVKNVWVSSLPYKVTNVTIGVTLFMKYLISVCFPKAPSSNINVILGIVSKIINVGVGYINTIARVKVMAEVRGTPVKFCRV